MNRIDRLTAILIQLQSRRVVRAKDIADRFEISLRTVYRDIRALEEAGVPLLSEAGVGYSIMDGYRLPPVMFTRDEATAFLTAEKLVEKLTDPSTATSYKSALYKVKAVLQNSERDLLERADNHIEVLHRRRSFGSSLVEDTLQTLLKSTTERRVAHIRYRAMHSGEITERDIEPLGIFYNRGYWYSIAFCRLRNDYRDFRTDRITDIALIKQQFEDRHPDLKTYLEQRYRERDLQTIVIRVDKDTTKYLSESKYYNGFVSEVNKEDHVEMTFLYDWIGGFARWYLTFADHAEIVEPIELKDHISSIVSNITARLSTPGDK